MADIALSATTLQQPDVYRSYFRKRYWLPCLALVAITLAATSAGFLQDFGHFPEEVRRISIATEMASSGDLNPRWFGHPASLLHYALAFLYRLLFFGKANELRQLYLENPASLFIIGRTLARLFAVLSVLLCFEIASRLLPACWAFIAAVIAAINPQFVMLANWGRADHMLTFFLLVGTIMLIRLQRSGSTSQAVLFSAFSGVAVTYKYTAVALFGSLLVAHAARRGVGKRRLLVALGLFGVMTVAAFLVSPFLFLDWRTSLADVAYETGKGAAWNPLAALVAMVTVCRYAFSDVGTALLSFGILRGVLMIWRESRRSREALRDLLSNPIGDPLRALVLIATMYSLQTMLNTIYSERWFAPVVPFASIAIVVQLHWLWTHCKSYVGSLAPASLLPAVISAGPAGMIVQHQLHELIALSRSRQQASTIARAEDWLSHHLRPGDKILLLQAHRAGVNGQFPRIMKPGIQMYTARPDGSFQRVCLGEQGDSYRTHLPLSQEICYPRPKLYSSTSWPLPILLEQFDFVVLVNGAKVQLNSAELSWLAQALARLHLARPIKPSRLEYPPTTIAPTDSGAWQEIRVYTLRGKSDVH